MQAPQRIDISREQRSPSPNGAERRSAGWGWLRCPVKADTGDGSGFSSELAGLLQDRLRLAATILAVTYFGMIALQVVRPETLPLTAWDKILSMVVGLAAAGIAGLLWRRKGLALCPLRRLETLLFGIVAADFTWLSLIPLNEATKTNLLQAAEPQELNFRLALLSFVLIVRWGLLIVIYGTFIPNTARRTASVVGFFALLPFMLLIPYFAEHGALTPYLANVFPINLMVIGVSVAVAIFGSHKISMLQQEAYVSRQLGQYRLKSRLGLGGMGEVYLAEHLLLKRPCVVKLIRSERAGDPNTQARFEREVKAMATLTHWNTVAVFDYGRTADGVFYYVMEYLPGLSLQEMVTSYGPMPAARVVFLLRQVCAALNEAHAIGLIHRDIKPSNIIVCPWGGLHDVVKLLDFGLVFQQELSRGDGKLTRDGFIVGTPDFMSPEQAQDAEQVDARSDLYSLGAVAWYLLTGKPVFERKNALQAVVAHAHEPPPALPPGVPRAVAAIVVKCLEKRPSQRYASAKELGDALADAAQDLPWTEADAADWWARHQESDKAAQFDTPTLVTAAPAAAFGS